MQVSDLRTSQVVDMSMCPVFPCGRCSMMYGDYKQLLEHLYWRHGTESQRCKDCGLRRWRYAAHICNILPIFIEFLDEPIYKHCYCGKEVENVPMIGCDGPACALQWYHFPCVGIVRPPDGDWLCPECRKSNFTQAKQNEKT